MKHFAHNFAMNICLHQHTNIHHALPCHDFSWSVLLGSRAVVFKDFGLLYQYIKSPIERFRAMTNVRP